MNFTALQKKIIVIAAIVMVAGSASVLYWYENVDTDMVAVEATAGGTATGNGTYHDGDTVTLTASADHGYTFSEWTEDGKKLSGNASITVTVHGDRCLKAVFVPIKYAVTVSENYGGAGTVSGAGTYDYNSAHTFTATTNSGYSFVGWYINGKLVSASSSFKYTVTGSAALTAKYSIVHDASFTVSESAKKAPLTLSTFSEYNVQVQTRTWTYTDAVTGSTIRTFQGSGFNATSLVFSNGEAVNITQTVTYTDGVRSTHTEKAVVDQDVTRTFTWHYQVKTWYSGLTSWFLNNREETWNQTFSYAWYYGYVSDTDIPRSCSMTAGVGYVTYDDRVIETLAASLSSLMSGHTSLEKANCILKFVQSIPYAYDTDTHSVSNYWDYPAELLYEQKGDCEDHAVLLSALYKAAGYDNVLYYVKCYDSSTGETDYHVAVGTDIPGASGTYTTYAGVKYYYCEGTATESAGIVDYSDVGDKPSGYTILGEYPVK